MTRNAHPLAPSARTSWRNSRVAYGLVTIFFHWTIAILFIVQLGLGYMMSRDGIDPVLQFDLFQYHKSTGFLVLALAVPRLIWSLFSPRPQAVDGMTRMEALAARAVHLCLLFLTIAVPLSGWAVASTSPLQIPSYVFDLFVMPGLPLTISDEAEAMWTAFHSTLAWTAAALVLLHAGAALWHHVVRRDHTLRRMLPGSKRM